MEKKTIAEQIAFWSDKLRDMSALGLRFSKDIYDRERYESIQDMAIEMLAVATDKPLGEIEALRLQHFSRPTPLPTADAAVIDKEGRMLLMQRADNKMWAMPGGALEVGESAAEGAVREVLEETGVHCIAKELVSVFDSQHMKAKFSIQLYMFNFLCEPDTSKEVETAEFANETLMIDWFAEADLPEALDPKHVARIPKAFEMWRDRQANSGNGISSYFDK